MLLLACVWYKYPPLLLLPDALYTEPRPHTPPPPLLGLVLFLFFFFSFLHLSLSFPASFPCLGVQGGHAKDLAPALAAELSGDDAVDAGADGVTGLVDENAGVVVETDDAAVGALGLLARAHHDRVPDVPPLHLVRRRRRRRPHPRVAGAPLLLHDRYESVACRLGGVGVVAGWWLVRSAFGRSGVVSLYICLEYYVPILACRLCPMTRAHSTIAAPELSMQFSID